MDRLTQMTAMVKAFCDERNWDQFHAPKDLAIGLVTEASELLEKFRFQSEADVERLMANAVERQAIGEELADCLFFVLRFAERNQFDLMQVLQDKIAKNASRYPIEKARNSNQKYQKLQG